MYFSNLFIRLYFTTKGFEEKYFIDIGKHLFDNIFINNHYIYIGKKMENDRIYIAIDLKSFYASVECAERGLDPLKTNLVEDGKDHLSGCVSFIKSIRNSRQSKAF